MTTSSNHPLSVPMVQDHLARHSLPRESADRFASLADTFAAAFPEASSEQLLLASAPGRTELAGNHTDHNLGRVLAASINLDTIAVVRGRTDHRVRVKSEGFPSVELSAREHAPVAAERESSAAVIRGMIAGFAGRGLKTGGFDATVSSRVLGGSGLSSSASFEVLIGAILNGLYNENSVDATTIAQIGQVAENEYFGKPSGLMDQVACATGGAVRIDFKDLKNPIVEHLAISFESLGYALCVVDTGGSHADLTDEYAAIPAEMGAVASSFDAKNLREVPERSFYSRVAELRKAHGDRAVNRAMHFYAENARVDDMVDALRVGDIRRYLWQMHASGTSSSRYLQNGAPPSSPREQAVVSALGLAEHTFTELGLRTGRDATARVHGGGFAGTIQVLLPSQSQDDFVKKMHNYLGAPAVTPLSLRPVGAIAFALQEES